MKANTVEIADAMEALLRPGQIVELRALNVGARDGWSQTHSGYYDDVAAFARDAAALSGRASAVYFLLNPAKPALLSRAANRCRPIRQEPTTADHDILARNFLPIDIDPVRPSGISATDQEHRVALDLALVVRADLEALNWPSPFMLDSGNGAHLLYRVDLPVDDGGLIQRVLIALAERYDRTIDGVAVKIDTGNFNPARIWKVPGTLAAKGDSTAERPHRLARLLEVSHAG